MDNYGHHVSTILFKRNTIMDVKMQINSHQIAFQPDAISVEDEYDFGFKSPLKSFEVFNKLRDMGIKCYHAGNNAPNGPSVMIYEKENKGLKISIK